MKKNKSMLSMIRKSKYFVSGIVVGLLLLSFGTYAATIGIGTIGSLFEKIGTDYKLVGSNIKTATVSGLQIQNFSIQEDDLASDSISTFKVINGTILQEDLANNSISTTKIINGTILGEDLAGNSVSTTKIINGTILEEDLADNSVSTTKIINGTILGEDLADNSVSTATIKDGTIKSQDLAFSIVNTNNYVPISDGTYFIDSNISQNGTFVGIGIPSPTSKLDVAGKIKGDSLVVAGRIKGESSLIENLNLGGVGGPGRVTGWYRGNNTNMSHLIAQNINPNGISEMQVRGAEGSYINSFGNIDAPLAGLLMYNSNKLGAVVTNTKDLAFLVWGSERMRIKDNGYIGIGTKNPTDKLQVEGNVSAYSPIDDNHLVTKEYVDTLFINLTTYNWVIQTGWTSCSVTCGSGTKSRVVQCIRGDGTLALDSLCTSGKPSTTTTCTMPACGGGGGGGSSSWGVTSPSKLGFIVSSDYASALQYCEEKYGSFGTISIPFRNTGLGPDTQVAEYIAGTWTVVLGEFVTQSMTCKASW